MRNVMRHWGLLLCAGFAFASAVTPARAEAKMRKALPRTSAATSSASDEGQILSRSKKVKTDLEIWPARIREKLADVKEKLDSLDFDEIKVQRYAIGDFQDLLELVDDEAAAIESAWANVKGEFALWSEAVMPPCADHRGTTIASAFVMGSSRAAKGTGLLTPRPR